MTTAIARGCLMACTLLTPLYSQHEPQLSLPPGWRLDFRTVTRDYILMEFVTGEESVEQWTELVTVQQFRRRHGEPPLRELFRRYKELNERVCPGATEWRTIDEDGSSLVFEEKTTAACNGNAPHSEIGRFIYAKDYWYRIAYTRRADLTEQLRTTWLAWLRSVSVGDGKLAVTPAAIRHLSDIRRRDYLPS